MFVVNKDQEKAAIKGFYHAFSMKVRKKVNVAQSLNKTLTCKPLEHPYLFSIWKSRKISSWGSGLEYFYPDVNVEQYIQIPWSSIQQIGANVTLIANQSPLWSLHWSWKIPLCFQRLWNYSPKSSGKTWQWQGCETSYFTQTIGQNLKNLFAKK